MSKVLIVDDEETILEVAAAILSKYGHTSVCASDTESALNAIKSGGIDAALVDIVLPGRGGLDLLMEIRRDYPNLPVIVMSGKVRTDSAPFIHLATQFGAKCILPKPFTPAELMESLDSVMRCAQAQ